jgi:hypothetical protein
MANKQHKMRHDPCAACGVRWRGRREAHCATNGAAAALGGGTVPTAVDVLARPSNYGSDSAAPRIIPASTWQRQ